MDTNDPWSPRAAEPSLDEFRRLEALKAAVKSTDPKKSSYYVLNAARKFEAYLKGDDDD